VHGTIFVELRKFVDSGHPPGTWDQLLELAGLPGREWDPLRIYPDEEALALVGAACQLTGLSADEVLAAFGTFIAPDLLRMYWGLVDESWRTLDVLANTEQVIHRVVRLDHPGAEPPPLVASRVGPDEVVIVYRSPRRMCALAKGIARGVADHYGERLAIEERTCMHRGDAECLLSFRREA
jgi:hypothetical protein